MQDVVLDACCLINLVASAKILAPAPLADPTRRKLKKPGAPSRGSALKWNLHVPTKVKSEARFIRQPDKHDATKLVQAEIDLAPLFEKAILLECDLQLGLETDLFVEFATKLDDGEAVCLAIAKERGWHMASDDRPTEKLAKEHGVSLVTTPEIVKHWALSTKATEEEIGRVLRNIETYAHYFPRKSLPLYKWWTDCVSKRSTT